MSRARSLLTWASGSLGLNSEGFPSRLHNSTLNWLLSLELNSCDSGASHGGRPQRLMVLMSVSCLSAHLHKAVRSRWLSKPCWILMEQLLKCVIISFTGFDVERTKALRVRAENTAAVMLRWSYLSLWLLIVLLNYIWFNPVKLSQRQTCSVNAHCHLLVRL